MKKNLLFIVFILTVQSLFADEGVVYWGTPAWDKKTASFEISPREAEKYFFLGCFQKYPIRLKSISQSDNHLLCGVFMRKTIFFPRYVHLVRGNGDWLALG